MQFKSGMVRRTLVFLLALFVTVIPTLAEASFVNPQLAMKAPSVASVKFSKTSLRLAIGATYKLSKKLVVLPRNAKDKKVTWTSSNETIATVDENGKVTVLAKGTVTITARSDAKPAKKATCRIKCVYVSVKTITLNAKNMVCDVGDTHTPTAKIKPTNATVKRIQWTSEDDKIAEVDENGKITAVAPGVVKIIAKAASDAATAKFTVRVRGGDMEVIKLSAIGDVVLGGDKRRVKKADNPIGDGKTSFTRFKALYDAYGANYFFGNVDNITRKDDITIANLEGVLTNAKSHQNKTLVLSGPPRYTDVLTSGGVDVVSIANNHANDFYQQGHKDTIKALNQAGVSFVGQGRTKMMTKKVNGVMMGFASFQTPASRAEVKASIRTLKTNKRCAIVVVSFHWAASREWTSKVTTAERSLARFAINNGADLILGHHKHMVSGIERYKNKMIAYDLANFVSMIRHIDEAGKYVTKDSMIYQQRFNIFSDGFIEVAPPSIIPLLNSQTLETFTGQSHVLTGSEAERVLEQIRARSPSGSRNLVQTIPGY